MAYTHSVKEFLHIWRLAPLLACLLAGGCVNDVAVEPEGTNLLWKSLEYPPGRSIQCLAIDPDGRIFLGAHDYMVDHGWVVWFQNSIYLSSDNGETWATLTSFYPDIEDVATDSEGRVFAATDWGIMRSTDHGEHWEDLSLDLRDASEATIVTDSDDNIYLRTSLKGIYFSGDHGDSWTQIGQGLLDAGYLISLDVNSKGCLFAIADGNLYRSCDRGGSWTPLPEGEWGESISSVAIDSADRVFVSNLAGLYRSTDDGETWTALPTPPEYHAYRISFDRRDRLSADCGNRLYASENGGNDWTLMLRLYSNSLSCIAWNPAGEVFAAGGWGLSRSTDEGASWEMLGFSSRGPVDITVDGNGYLYLGMESGGIYRTRADLESWEKFSAGFPDVRVFCLASTGESKVLAGTSNGVYVSPQDGPAWSHLGLAGRVVERLFVLSDGSVAAFSGGLFITTDGGSTWNAIGLDGYDVRALIRTSDGSLLAGVNFGGIFRYTGEGTLWDQMNTGLGNLAVSALVLTRLGDIIAGTDAGMFISQDGGASWRRYLRERPRITALLAVGEELVLVTDAGVLLKRPDEFELIPEDEGLLRWDRKAIRSIERDSNNHLFVLSFNGLYRSAPL